MQAKAIKKYLICAITFIGLFIFWTFLILNVDVKPTGVNATFIGLATLNHRFHNLTGVHFASYYITDWLSLVPAGVCVGFAVLGLYQWIKRKNPFKVDCDILILGVYYVVVFVAYLTFEMIPINYRPVLIEGRLEVSYPSSTTLLVLCVMPTLAEQIGRRVKNEGIRKAVKLVVVTFSFFMVLGRLVSGVHWFTDIVGGILLSMGLYYLYKTAVRSVLHKK